MPVKSATVANKFLELAGQKGRELTPPQLIYLVYIAHAYYLVAYRAPLINDPIKAWPRGPLTRSMYTSLLKDGYNHRNNTPIKGPLSLAPHCDKFIKTETDIIEKVFALYGTESLKNLHEIVAYPGTPWFRVYVKGKLGGNISNKKIRDFYKVALVELI